MKAIIFDMDGVIINSEPVHFEVEQELLEKLGGKMSKEAHVAFVGTTDHYMWSTLKEQFNLEPAVEKIIKMKKEMFIEKFDEIELMDNFKELMLSLYNEGYPMAIASSNNRKIVNKVVEKFGLSNYMNFIISGEEVHKGKPDPEIFLTAAKKINVNPKCCLVIEDASNGVKAAKAAKMKCVGLENIYSGNQDLSEADLVINNLAELDLNIIKELLAK